MRYIVKNCRAYNEPWCGDSMDNCINCTDCVIKQVIDRCNKDKIHKYDYKVSKDILNMFEIERVKE